MLDYSRNHSALYDHLYFIFVRVRVVGNGPTAVGHYLLVVELPLGNGTAEHRDSMADIIVLGYWTSPAKIRECPAAVFDEALICNLFGDFD